MVSQEKNRIFITNNKNMKKEDNFDAGKRLVENKITFQSKLNENFTIGQAIKSVEGEDAEILKISTYDKNKKAIDSSIAQSGWEPQSGTPKEELTWYLVDNGNYQEWYDEEELSTNNKKHERNN